LSNRGSSSDGIGRVSGCIGAEGAQSWWPAKDMMPGEIRPIREMSLTNRLWGTPRVHGELVKLGIDVAQSIVAKYMARSGRERVADREDLSSKPFGRYRSMDFLIMPTVGFRLLFVLVILRHKRRRLISLSVTVHPTADWTARQITDASPWEGRQST
jgi:hypothetical protein